MLVATSSVDAWVVRGRGQSISTKPNETYRISDDSISGSSIRCCGRMALPTLCMLSRWNWLYQPVTGI